MSDSLTPKVAGIVRELRSQPNRPDELQRRRMEQRLLSTLRRHGLSVDDGRGAATRVNRVSGIVVSGKRSAFRPVVLGVATVVVILLIGWGLVLVGSDPTTALPVTSKLASGASSPRHVGEDSVPTPHVEWTDDDRPPFRQIVFEGMRLRPTGGEQFSVRLGAATLRAGHGAVVTLDRVEPHRRDVAVSRGTLEAELHPKRAVHETLAIHTPSARIKVVGTVLTVTVTDRGETSVEVRQGRVRVFDLVRGTAAFLHAGEGALRIPAGDSTPASPSRRELEDDRGSEEIAPLDLDPTVSVLEPRAGSRRAGSANADAARPGHAPAHGADTFSAQHAQTPPRTPGLRRNRMALGPWAPGSFGDVDARLVLAERLLEAGALERGRHVLYQVVREPASPADGARAWLRLGQSFQASHDWQHAAEAYRRAIRIQPTSPVAAEARNELCVLVDDWQCSLL